MDNIVDQRLRMLWDRSGLEMKDWYYYDGDTKQLLCLGQLRSHDLSSGRPSREVCYISDYSTNLHLNWRTLLGFQHHDIGRQYMEGID